MRPIQLNHLGSTSKVHLPAISLLLIGCLAAAWTVVYCQQLTTQAHALEADIEQLTHTNPVRTVAKVNTPESAQKSRDTAAVNAAIAEIVLPWPSVFKTLEATSNEEIKLLAVEPNMKKQRMRLTALALDVDGMMNYVDDLVQQTTQQKMLKNVALVSQEAAEVNGQAAIHFVVEATW